MTSTQPILKAPFPWFGGKSRAAHLIWPRFGNPGNYVEPFAGSLAVLLNRPHQPGNEIVNDLDCYVANAWRAMKLAPEEVARYCDWPVNEADLHARHRWLHGRLEFRKIMENDPDHYDARIAGYWIWGLSCWIGDNFCRPNDQNARPHTQTKGVCQKLPTVDLESGRQGVSRQVPHLTGGKGDEAGGAAPDRLAHGAGKIWRQRPIVGSNGAGNGVHKNSVAIPTKRPKCQRKYGIGAQQRSWDGAEKEIDLSQTENLIAWFNAIAARLRFTKVCCGDWARVCTKAATFGQGLTAVLLDPPYDPSIGLDTVYGDLHGKTVSAEVRAWAIENGSNPLMRIALCGYVDEHTMPDDWECVAWKASGGYAAAAGNTENSKRERIWFSPHCLKPEPELFKL